MDFESPENDDDDDFHIEKIQTKFIDKNLCESSTLFN